MASFKTLAAAALTSLAATAAQAVIVYDAFVSLPAAQGWTTLSIGNPGSNSLVDNLFTTDSTGAGVDTWGYSRFSPVTLDPQLGFSVNFSLRLPIESHSSANRAGFSMLFVTGTPSQSIELAFHQTEVMAYEYVPGTGFVLDNYRAVFGVQDTLHLYTLDVANGQFALRAMGNTLISGALQDYTPQGLPYTLPGFIFFGDNTSSGSSVAQLSVIDIIPVPEPQRLALFAAGLALVAWRVRRAR